MRKKYYDIHVHLLDTRELKEELNLSKEISEKLLRDRLNDICSNVSYANVMIMDSRMLDNDNVYSIIKTNLKAYADNLSFTAMVDLPYDKDKLKLIERADEAGIKGIKIHPYIQKIREDDYHILNKLVDSANDRGMKLFIDCYCNTYNPYNGIKIAYDISSRSDIDIILCHMGGTRICDAIDLARSRENIFLETSFTMSRWKNSSKEVDIGLALNLFHDKKIVYGSDSPYVAMHKSLSDVEYYFEKYNIDAEARDDIRFGNAYRLMMG